MDRVTWVPPPPVIWMHLLSLSVGNNNMQIESALVSMQTNNINVFFQNQQLHLHLQQPMFVNVKHIRIEVQQINLIKFSKKIL
jgi:hypothetical protein